MEDLSELRIGEIHPQAKAAYAYIKEYVRDVPRYILLVESLSSCAISGNRSAQVCGGTLERIMNNGMVSDHYVLGLAWFIKSLEELEKAE